MVVNVRVKYYKSRGGRSTGVETKIVPAIAIMYQKDHSLVVELLEAAFTYKKGHDLAIYSNDIIQ